MAAGSSMIDDDDSVLDISEQTNRPEDVALKQQRIPAWHPILDPVWVIMGLLYLGVILVPTGLKVWSLQDDVVEMKVTYDDFENPDALCGINTTFNANRTCELELIAPADMNPPILVYYELTNFHQNHRNYFFSRDQWQLAGENPSKNAPTLCDPLFELGGITLNPCGLIANTFFNDYFTLLGGRDASQEPLIFLEDGIAWQSDLDYAFKQPKDFRAEPCPEPTPPCDPSCCNGPDWTCDEPWEEDGTCYRFYYPDVDTTQYLYQTYPDIISPLEGVTNEHFVVWMRTATQPTFRKLYGWFDQPIKKDEPLLFGVNANYVVERFRGTKSLIVSTNNIFGGKNEYMGMIFFWSGIFCLGAAAVFGTKHLLRPRKIADSSYLHYKGD